MKGSRREPVVVGIPVAPRVQASFEEERVVENVLVALTARVKGAPKGVDTQPDVQRAQL